jgi:hypothetical protein
MQRMNAVYRGVDGDDFVYIVTWPNHAKWVYAVTKEHHLNALKKQRHSLRGEYLRKHAHKKECLQEGAGEMGENGPSTR